MNAAESREYWEQKSDEELLNALTDVEDYEPNVQAAILAESARRPGMSPVIGDFIIESPAEMKPERRSAIGCLGALLFAVLTPWFDRFLTTFR